jgi:predicted  nucleic acid-binding Zn-ribbon protein
MSYPPSQPQSSSDLQAEYTKVLARTGALFYQLKAVRSNLAELEKALTAAEAEKARLEAEYKVATDREKAAAAPADSLQQVETA